MREVEIRHLPLHRVRSELEKGDGDDVSPQERQFDELAERAPEALRGRKVWNVSSTETGGGVAEMLRVLIGYAREAGVDARWLVLEGEGEFFAVTKRIHNFLHASEGDGKRLDEHAREVYEAIQDKEAEAFRSYLSPDDIVILHDPQPLGLVQHALDAGCSVIWRCHIGTDADDRHVDEAWEFLRPYVEKVPRNVFTREDYVPEWLRGSRWTVIPPSVDPGSTKNMSLPDQKVVEILQATGVFDLGVADETDVELPDGDVVHVASKATIVREDGPLPQGTVPVVQVSRWDALKDMAGVLQAFADGVVGHAGCSEAHLLLVGPDVSGVSDDPEGQQVLADVTELWRSLPEETRRHASLVSLPMDDVDENALMVNALQRRARVVVQKSIMEGFGLTVSEAMWKGRPVVASKVGGIQDQVVDGETGYLVDPRDLETFAERVCDLVKDGHAADEMGRQGWRRVQQEFLPDRHLGQWLELLVEQD